MAKIKDNYVTHGIRGKIGDKVFKHNKFGNTYISDPPDLSNVIPTKRQRKLRNNFAKAVAYAKSVLKDPIKAEKYQTGDNKSLYVKALKDYLHQHKAARKKAARLVIDDSFCFEKSFKPPANQSTEDYTEKRKDQQFRLPAFKSCFKTHGHAGPPGPGKKGYSKSLWYSGCRCFL